MAELLASLLQEEQGLQFSHFDKQTAQAIGSKLVARASSENLSVTVDITRGAHQLFHVSLPGTSAGRRS